MYTHVVYVCVDGGLPAEAFGQVFPICSLGVVCVHGVHVGVSLEDERLAVVHVIVDVYIHQVLALVHDGSLRVYTHVVDVLMG